MNKDLIGDGPPSKHHAYISEHVRTGMDRDRIQDCLDVIDELGIPGPAGAPTVRETLTSR